MERPRPRRVESSSLFAHLCSAAATCIVVVVVLVVFIVVVVLVVVVVVGLDMILYVWIIFYILYSVCQMLTI